MSSQRIVPIYTTEMAPKRKRPQRSPTQDNGVNQRPKIDNEVQQLDVRDPSIEHGHISAAIHEQSEAHVPSENDQRNAPASHNNTAGFDPHARLMLARYEEAHERFLPLLHAARAQAGDITEWIRPGDLLHEEQVMLAIMVVTEAVEYKPIPGDATCPSEKFYDIATPGQISTGKFPTTNFSGDSILSARPGRPVLIPWFYNSAVAEQGGRDLLEVAKAIKKEDRKHRSHTFLIRVRRSQNLCEIRVYDSYRLSFRNDPNIWQGVMSDIKTVIRNIRWFPEDLEDPASDDLAPNFDDRFAAEQEAHVAHQNSSWACGIHTILNAWCVAMNLSPNPRFGNDATIMSDFYELAAEIINLAVAGHVDSNLIYAFLVATRFALASKDRMNCPRFDALRNVHSITSIEALHDHVNGYVAARASVRNETAQRPSRPRTLHPPGSQIVGPSNPPAFVVDPQLTTNLIQSGQVISEQAPIQPGAHIDPAIMSYHGFANPDCQTFWHFLNSMPAHMGLLRQGLLTQLNSVQKFIWYVGFILDRASTEAMTVEQRTTWFGSQRRLYDQALYYDATKLQLPAQTMFSFLSKQLHCIRSMANGIVISMAEREQLIAMYSQAIGNPQPVQEFWSLRIVPGVDYQVQTSDEHVQPEPLVALGELPPAHFQEGTFN